MLWMARALGLLLYTWGDALAPRASRCTLIERYPDTEASRFARVRLPPTT